MVHAKLTTPNEEIDAILRKLIRLFEEAITAPVYYYLEAYESDVLDTIYNKLEALEKIEDIDDLKEKCNDFVGFVRKISNRVQRSPERNDINRIHAKKAQFNISERDYRKFLGVYGAEKSTDLNFMQIKMVERRMSERANTAS